jgi:hypothetical protein
MKQNISLKQNDDSHIWQFSRVGGVNRVNLEKGSDITSLELLDQKLWTALSSPVYGLEIDFRTLELIDADKDERIRVPEIIEAVKWVTSLIKNPDDLVKDNKFLPLDAISDSSEQGKILLSSAKQILSNIGKPDDDKISVEETSDTVRIFAGTKFNGDGIITETSADNDNLKSLIRDIISCMGSVTDRNGEEGISENHVLNFFKSCENYSTWFSRSESEPLKILPFGDSTAEALAAYFVVKSKIEDYFLRCHLAAFSPDSSDILTSLRPRYEEIRYKDLTLSKEEIASFPLAAINPEISLSIIKGINPMWEKEIEKFRESVVLKYFPGKADLTEKDLETINKRFEDYIKWQAEKQGTETEKLGLSRIREILKSNSLSDLMDLITRDKAMETNSANIFLVDKLVRYYCDIFRLLRNYVTFYDFYSPGEEAIFQAGKLYIDQRCCDLCLKVTDMNKHNTLARSSGLCLIYCNCYSKTNNERMTIVAALTDGDIDSIDVGRNGIFYDRKGNHWDATIIKVVDNPISIRQAFWSPYRKVSKFITTQIDKVATAKEKEVDAAAATGIEKASGKIDSGIKDSIHSSQSASPSKQAPPVQPFDIGKFVGIFAALSLALGAIGSVLMSILTGFFSLSWWMMPVALLGLMLVISGPSMIIAWLKLRKRNLAPLLDANGWAINARATINIIFGKTLTHLATLPPNSKLNLVDPFAKKRRPFIPILLAVIVIIALAITFLWYFGYLEKWNVI